MGTVPASSTSSDGSPGGGPSLFLCAVGIGSVSGKDGAHVWGGWRTCRAKMAYIPGGGPQDIIFCFVSMKKCYLRNV